VTGGIIATLADAGWKVMLTGSAAERVEIAALATAAGPGVEVLAGATSIADFARVIAGASAVVCGNTGAAHLAAAVGTPVVEAFAPVVPAARWHPWRCPHVLLGTLDIGCAGCRSRICPLPDQPCLAPLTPASVLAAVESLAGLPDGSLAEVGT
jgi:ADP-heptose:LPS heptosyltransferase